MNSNRSSAMSSPRRRSQAAEQKDVADALSCRGADDDEPSASAEASSQQQPPKKRRGRPPKKSLEEVPSSSTSTTKKATTVLITKDTSKDVLSVKGAAAQTITNPGNLHFYQLCEERYDEFATLDSANPRRRIIAGEIVDAITATGGTFHKQSGGGRMNRPDAIRKTVDRLRQIGKPKLRPTGFGKEDVVFAKGAANFLYPGNSKWRAMLDGYVQSYFRHLVDEGGNVVADAKSNGAALPKQQRKKNGKFVRGNKMVQSRPSYQLDIVNETIGIIHGRGGKFRDEMLNELSDEVAASKTHNRFKDLKKKLIAGTRTFASHDNDLIKEENGGNLCAIGASSAGSSAIVNEEKEADGSTLTGTEIFKNRLGGFTSVKAVASNASELKALEKKMNKVQKKRSKQSSSSSRRRSSGGYNNSDSDNDSFCSAMLDSNSNTDSSSDDDESSLDGAHNVDSDWEDMVPKRIQKRKQDEEREARLKRRKSGMVQQKQQQPTGKKQKRRQSKIKKQEKCNPPSPDHPLSEYELYRLEKIKRNRAKLAELGL